jgi:cytoskeletal protein CcmA (bactofilin family)
MPINSSQTPKQTVLEGGTEFKGTLKSSCPIVVNGTIEGDVSAPELTINRSGALSGNIKADKVHFRGTLSGNVEAGEVFLAGIVRSNTFIKAKRLEMKLGSDKGLLEVKFGECNLDVNDAPLEEESSSASAAALDTAAIVSTDMDDWATHESPESASPANGGSGSERSVWRRPPR